MESDIASQIKTTIHAMIYNMRKYLLHVLIISFVFLYPLILHARICKAENGRGIDIVIKDSKGNQVGLYEESHALVIGIDNYTKGWSRLTNAVKDADAIAEELEKQGFEVTLRKDLRGTALREELRQFFVIKGKNSEARLLLWFSGHGHTLDGEGFLIPSDAPPHTAGQFKVTSLHMRDFGGFVRLAKSKHVLSIFDSCFAGTIFNTRSGVPSPAITRATVLPVRQFLTSGDANQQVSDDGSFRELFLRAIRGEEWADANDDGYLTGSELGNYLSDRVTNLTNAAQIPRYGKLLDVKYDRGDFVFALDESQTQLPVSPKETGELDFGDIDAEMEKTKKIAEIRNLWSKWQNNLNTAYDKALKYDKDAYLSASKKAQVWKRLANSFSQDNPYSTEDQLIRSKAVERFKYWRNYKEPTPPVTSRQEPSYVGTSIIKLRSSYKTLSDSQVDSIPNVYISKKKDWGFYGHSTISHNYEKRSINGDGVVIDHATGLMWHQNGSEEGMSVGRAKWWAGHSSKGYAGYHDWRLPTLEEAVSLLQFDKNDRGLYIDPVFSDKQSYIWTGDIYGSEAAWHVGFGYGGVGWFNGIDDDRYHVRPVRSVR